MREDREFIVISIAALGSPAAMCPTTGAEEEKSEPIAADFPERPFLSSVNPSDMLAEFYESKGGFEGLNLCLKHEVEHFLILILETSKRDACIYS